MTDHANDTIDGKIKKLTRKLLADDPNRDQMRSAIGYRFLRAGFRLLTRKDSGEAIIGLRPDGGVRMEIPAAGCMATVVPDNGRDVILEARDTFHAYAQNHLAKDPPQAEKAARNIEMAQKLSAILGEDYTAPENVLVDEIMGADAPREAQEADSALPGMAAGVPVVINAVAAIRATMDTGYVSAGKLVFDDETILDQIDQHLDRVMLVTDADVPAYIRTCAVAAMKTDTHTARVLTTLAESIEKGLHTGPEDQVKALREITDMIGEGNVKAGWWSDANVDLRDCPYTVHVVGGKLMLVCSEVSEAMEGWRKSQKTILMDDHLPDRPMIEVEIADAHIRLFDLGANVRLPGGRVLDVPGAIIDKLAYNAERADHKPENRNKEGGKAA